MDVIVKSKNCDVGDRLRAEAVERVQHATRFFDRLTGVELVFSEEPNPRIPEPALVELTGRTKGHHIRAEGSGQDHRKAVDAALSRFERQLARYKARLVDRQRRSGKPQPASTGTLDAWQPESTEAREAQEDQEPRIVRTKRFEMAPMVPEDAALQLELLGHDFFLFKNAATGECSVLYRRADGDLGLIEAVG